MFTLTIKTDNAAFFDDWNHGRTPKNSNYEVRRILENTIIRLSNGGRCGTLHDANGNTVGKWGFDDEE